MFSNNEKISLRQLKRLLVFDLFSVSGLIIPRIAAASSGKDGIITIILAALYAFVYVWIIMTLSKHTGSNFLEYSDRSVGKVLTFIIGSLYMIKQFVCCVFAARLFGEVINETLLEDTDPRFIILLLLMVSAYAASKGFEVRARIAEVLYFIVMVPIFVFLLLGLGKVDITNLAPVFNENIWDIIKGSYDVFLTFSILELLIFVTPLIKYKQSDIKRGKRFYTYVSHSLAIVGVLNVLLYIVTMGILGKAETQQKLWSMVTMIQVIKLPGGFIQRQDAIILGIWMLSIFTIISAFFYYMGLIGKHIFHVPRKNYLLIPYIILLFFASIIPMETEQFFFYFEKYMRYIGMPQSILLPLIVVLIGKLRASGQKLNKTAVKSILLLLTFTSVSTLTGCSDMTEIEDRNFIQVMSIDYKDNEIIVDYILPDLKKVTEQGNEDPEKLVLELKGRDYWKIEEDYSLKYNKRLDFSQMKAIILGREIAENAEQMKEFLTYVENKYEIGRNTLIFVSDTTAKDIIDRNGDLENGLGEYLDRMYRVNTSNTGKKQISVGNMIHAMNEINPVVLMPVLKAEVKSVKNSGLGLFKQNKLYYMSGEEEAEFINIVNGNGKNYMIYLTDDPSEDLIKDKKEGFSKYIVKINSLTRTITFNWKNNKPYLKLLIEGIGIIEQGFKDSGEFSQAANARTISRIETRCNSIMKENILRSMDTIMKNSNIDFLNLYRLTSYKNKKIWLAYRNKEDQFIKDLDYTVEVDLKTQ